MRLAGLVFRMSRLPELVLRWIFVAFLVFVVINQVSFVPSRDHQIVMTVVTGIGLALLGVVIGTLAGLLGIGGGALAVPSLSMLFGASDLVARGTSLYDVFCRRQRSRHVDLRHPAGNVLAKALFKHLLRCFALGFRQELERLLARGGEPRHKKRDLSGIQRHSQYSERMNTVNFKYI